MRAKTLKSSQILRAHMPYCRRPGHKLSSFADIIFAKVLRGPEHTEKTCDNSIVL